MMKAFITGSRAYGMPRHKNKWEKKPSDVDLVVQVSPADLQTLVDCYVEFELGPAGGSWAPPDPLTGIREQASLKFGLLNLIICTRDEDYEMWREGTSQLKAKAPVTRDFAIELFERLRRKMKTWRLFAEETLA